MAKSSRFSISGTISMIDKISGPMKRAANNVRGFSAKMRRQFKMANFSVKKFLRSLKKVAIRTAQMGLFALGAALGIVTRQFVQFDDAIFSASAKFGDLNLSTAKGQETMERLRQTARKVGEETKFNAVEAAQGLEFLAMAGFNAEQAIALLPGVSNLAIASNLDLARTTDIASDALGAFGKMTDDTTQLTKNFNQVQDVLAKTVTSTNTKMEDLFETIKFGAPPFTAAGQSMETFNALAGRMAANSIKGSRAGTALRSMITRLQKPTKEVSKGLGMFDLSISDIIKDGKLLDMVDILEMMEKNGKKMTRQQRNAALTMIVGKNAVSGWSAIMNEGVDKTRKLQESLFNADGTAKKMAQTMQQSLGNKMKALGSAATELGFKFLEAFDGDARKGIDSLTEAIRAFDPTPIVYALKIITTAFEILFFPIKMVIDVFAKFGRDLGTIASIFTTPAIEQAIIKRPELFNSDTPASRTVRQMTPIQNFSSPESATINRNTTTTNKSALDINVNAPNYTEVEQRNFSPMMKLNMGVAN